MQIRRKLVLGAAALLLVVTSLFIAIPAPSVSAQTSLSGTFSGQTSSILTMNVQTGEYVSGSVTFDVTMTGDISGTYHVIAQITGGTSLTPNIMADFEAIINGTHYPVRVIFPVEVHDFHVSNYGAPWPGPWNWTQTVGTFGHPMNLWTTDSSKMLASFEATSYESGSTLGVDNTHFPNWQYSATSSFSGTWTAEITGVAMEILASQVGGNGDIVLSGPSGTIASVTYSTTGTGTMLVAQYATNPGGPPSKIPVGTYVEVNTNLSSQMNWPVEIRIYYTDAEVTAAGIDENTLKMYRWDGSSWVLVPDSGVDPSANYVWAMLYSFSDYGPMGDPTNTPTGSPVTVNLTGAVVTFTSVAAEGATVATTEDAPCGSLPSGLVGKGSAQHITTTATYTGPVTVGVRYNDAGILTEGDMRLLHCDGTNWHDVTTSVDTVNNIIYGQDSALSWWWIGDPLGGGGAGGGVPIFPSIYIGIGAAVGAGVLAYFVRRRLLRQA